MVLGQETSLKISSAAWLHLIAYADAGIGILFSIVGTLFVRISDSAAVNTHTVQKALNMGTGVPSSDGPRLYWPGLLYITERCAPCIEFTKWECWEPLA